MSIPNEIVTFPSIKNGEVIPIKLKNYDVDKKRFFGAVFIVAGTTIGAGMLALPMSVAALGLLNGSMMLAALWFVAYYSALVSIDLNTHSGGSNSIAKLANQYLGKGAGMIGAIVLMLLLNTLLAAYTSGASSLIQKLLATHVGIEVAQFPLMIGFTAVMAGLICIDMKILDTGNRIFFMIMMGVFIAMMLALAPSVKLPSAMMFVQHSGLSPWLIAVPLFFTSFGFHGSIPSIMSYCNNQQNTVKSAFFWGTLIPLATYILWIVGGLGIVYTTNHQVFIKLVNGQADLGNFVSALSDTIDSSWFHSFSWVLTLLAIITSFLGVAIGLFDYYKERLSSTALARGRFVTGFLTLGVPLIIALISEKTFEKILSFAGIFLSILAIGLPCVIWLNLKKENKISSPLRKNLVTGVLMVGIFIIVCEICNLFF